MKYRPVTPDFALQTAAARRVLVIEIAGLGDLVHSLPALRAIRCAYPKAELHCMVRAGHAGLLRLAPWIDRVLPYHRDQAPSPARFLEVLRTLREHPYDVVIEMTGSDHASVLARLTSAPHRLVRRPGKIKPRHLWRHCATDVMEHPFRLAPMFEQRQACLALAGITVPGPQLQHDRRIDTSNLPVMIGSRRRRYLHVSPFTRGSNKELSVSQHAAVLLRLHCDMPDVRMVISCSPSPRECSALDELLAALPFRAWKIFRGTLDLAQLAAVVRDAAMHLSGDTGSMHLAWLCGTPSVSWVMHRELMLQWAPVDGPHRMIVVDPWQLPDVVAATVVKTALELLAPCLPKTVTSPSRRKAVAVAMRSAP